MAANLPLRFARFAFSYIKFAIAAMWLAACPISSSAQVMYTIVDLGSPPSTTFVAGFGINSNGQIAARTLGTPDGKAYRLNPGQMMGDPGTDLGTLGFVAAAFGINSIGQVTGVSNQSGTSSGLRAFRTSATGLISDPGTNLGVLPGADFSWGYAINATGQVTGQSGLLGVSQRVFRTTSNGTLNDAGSDIGVLPSFPSGTGRAINLFGQVAGYCSDGSIQRAFRTSPMGRVDDIGTDLGTLGGSSSSAYGMNDAGQVVGSSNPAGSSALHAFRTSATGRISDSGTDLGALPGFTSSVAFAINNSGIVVGQSGRAFIYDNTMRDLNDLIPIGSGWLLTSANAINDLG